MDILLYFPILFIIFYFGFRSYKRNNDKIALLVFSLLMAFNVAITLLHVLEVSIPTPLDFITFVYKPFNNFLYSLFS
ncbi:hypothetical protein H1D32_17990 [Anaerobacillus sp. CMMVII]|uniref:hypothetical protein n=1 Tax=Anaerobacillus sp. CMMVII TaxID=2755588 RepID=UPI0021B7B5FD|nr:hypothetical protein [Anaerobacillus sp. CMMVII]MCT8139427.1 hypothetical protein [Anaerobacillus sp. CMMVII]